MCITTLFIIAKTRKQTSIDRRVNKDGVVPMYNGVLLSHEMNEVMPLAAT